MRAVVCRSYGPPESLELDEVLDPVPAPGQLLVRVHAAAVNFPDVLFTPADTWSRFRRRSSRATRSPGR